jgi:hypothetical protein
MTQVSIIGRDKVTIGLLFGGLVFLGITLILDTIDDRKSNDVTKDNNRLAKYAIDQNKAQIDEMKKMQELDRKELAMSDERGNVTIAAVVCLTLDIDEDIEQIKKRLNISHDQSDRIQLSFNQSTITANNQTIELPVEAGSSCVPPSFSG